MRTSLILLLLLPFYCVSQTFDSSGNFDKCPVEGGSKSQRLVGLNISKNRYASPAENDFNKSVTIKSLLVRGNDANRFSPDKAVSITGYVLLVKDGGYETCNCSSKTDLDTHIVLVTNTTITKGSYRIIVEVTPRMRYLMKQKGIDWSTQTLKKTITHKMVTVQGWLFFDGEHTSAAENTNPGNKKNWRGTAWEVHPITSIVIN